MKKIGKVLEKARKNKKISIDKVYKDTKIRPNIIEALEKGKFKDLLEPAYIKSFIKEYAVYLNLDPEPLLKEYSSRLSGSPLSLSSVERLSKKRDYAKGMFFLKKFLYIVIILIVAFVIIWGIRKVSKDINKFFKSRSSSVISSKNSVKGKGQLVSDNESLKLKIESIKDTWVQVQSDENIIFQRVSNKGAVQEFKADEGFRLWVGKASGIKLYLNDIPLNSIGRGVIKNILIDRFGIHMPNE